MRAYHCKGTYLETDDSGTSVEFSTPKFIIYARTAQHAERWARKILDPGHKWGADAQAPRSLSIQIKEGRFE